MRQFDPKPQALQNIAIDDFVASMQTKDNPLKIELFRNLINARFKDQSITWRAGHTKKGTVSGSTKALGLGVLLNNPSDVLFLVTGQKLKKWTGAAWADTDLTNLTSGLMASMKTMDSKDAATLLVSGNCQADSTNRYIADTQVVFTQDWISKFLTADGMDYAAFSPDGNGNVWIAYKKSSNGKGYVQKRSLTAGASVVAEIEFTAVSDFVASSSCYEMAIDNDSSGGLWIGYRSANAADMRLVHFNNAGTKDIANFDVTTHGTHVGGSYMSVAVDSSNNVWFAFSYNDGATDRGGFAKYNSAGTVQIALTNFLTTRVNDVACCVDASNNLLIAYYQNTNSRGELQRRASASGTQSGSTQIFTANIPKSPKVAVNSVGNIIIVYSDNTDGSRGKLTIRSSDLSLVTSAITFENTQITTSDNYVITIQINSTDVLNVGYTTTDGKNYFRRFAADGTEIKSRYRVFSSGLLFRIVLDTSGNVCFIYDDVTDCWVGRIIEKVWAIDQFIGKVVEITAGTGIGQKRLLTGNDGNRLYVEGYFDTAPDSTSTYSVYDIKKFIFLSNGTDSVFKHDGTTKTEFTNLPKAKYLEAHNGYLFYAGLPDDDLLMFSERGLGEQVSINNWIKIFPDGDTIMQIQKLGDALIIYKRRSIIELSGQTVEDFNLKKIVDYLGCAAPWSVATGNKYQFFLSKRGIELLNDVVSANSLEESIPISDPINKTIFDGTHSQSDFDNACGWCKDNKYFLDIGSRRYVYHILESAQKQKPIWSIDSVDASVRASAAVDFVGDQLLGSAASGAEVYYHELGADDAGHSFDFTMDFKDFPITRPDFTKMIERLNILSENTTASVTGTVSVSKDGAAYASAGTFDFQTISGTKRFMVRSSIKKLGIKLVAASVPGDNQARILQIGFDYLLENYAR